MASLPASDIEIGGEGGQNALKRLENTFDRVQSTWRPATTDECFEIVRRRLFQPVTADNFAARDAVARAFADMYRQAGTEYPDDCRQAAYERRLQTSYPIHPELFDRLFQDWSKLDRFQKTRGVLRLMAAVIHCLWERQDANLLIMPATLPMDDPTVRDELVRYLDENWTPVIEKDVDGPNALPLRLDRENPTFGRVSAARRVARTLYLGSAPTAGDSNPGIDDRRIRAGCVQPGETSATFGDALRRLSDQATHVYVDQGRYWLGTTPSVRRLAQDRAAQFARDTDRLHTDIVRRIREEQASRGDFVKVHPCPVSSSDVPDEREVRLVILAAQQFEQTAREQALAAGAAQPPCQPPDRTGQPVPHAHGLQVDRQQQGHRRRSLPHDHRSRLRPGGGPGPLQHRSRLQRGHRSGHTPVAAAYQRHPNQKAKPPKLRRFRGS
ncbi:MAG: DUF499 domain-containing protein [bacterium]